MTNPFQGVWPAMLTPLDDQGSPALGEIEKLVELFIEQQLDGIYLLGSTGQGPLLSLADRQAVAECVLRTASSRIPVMVHVGAITTDQALHLAVHAKLHGAAAISSVSPIYYNPGVDAIFEHYRRIGTAGELPFFVYHLSAVNNLRLRGGEYVDRLLQIPNVAGMKFTDHDLFQLGLLCGYAGDRLRIFSGADELICQAAVSGACGAIGTFYNIWGPTCQNVRRAFAAGAIETGTRFMRVFQKSIDEILNSHGIWSFLRAAMEIKYHIHLGPSLPPLGTADSPWPRRTVERILEAVDRAADDGDAAESHPAS